MSVLSLFENVPVCLHRINSAGIITWANRNELSTLGYLSSEVIGHHISVFSPDSKEVIDEFVEKCSRGTCVKGFQLRLMSKSGNIKYLLVDINVKWDTADDNVGFICNLTREDSTRIFALASAASEISMESTISAAKDNFIRKVFHEIKTPLHALYSLVSGKVISESDMIEVKVQLNSVFKIIEDIEFATMIGQGNFIVPKPQGFLLEKSVASLASKCVAEYDGGKNVHLNLSLPSSLPQKVAACPSIKRVLHHLVSNAVKFCSEGGSVTVSVALSEDSNHATSVEFSDCLCTIKKFFFTISNTTSQRINTSEIEKHYTTQCYSVEGDQLSSGKGMCLGLYVAYNMCRILGGSLSCSSTATSISFTCAIDLMVVDSSTAEIYERNKPEVGQSSLGTQYPSFSDFSWCSFRSSGSQRSDNDGLNLFSVLEKDEIEKFSDEVQKIKESILLRKRESELDVLAETQRITIGVPKSIALNPMGIGSPKLRTSTTVDANDINIDLTRLLIVDDSTICQKMMLKALAKHSCVCDVAGNGKVAVNMMKSDPSSYDAILMDLRMPIMDGITATQILREEMNVTIPILVLSAEVGAEIQKSALRVGASGFLSKPARAQEILRELSRLGVVSARKKSTFSVQKSGPDEF